MLSDLNWAYVVLALVVVLLFGISRPCLVRMRAIAAAVVAGDFDTACQHRLWLCESRSLGARFLRWKNPGGAEQGLAQMLLLTGDFQGVLRWCDQGLRRARLADTRAGLLQLAARTCALQSDLDGMESHLLALQKLSSTMSDPATMYYAPAVWCRLHAGQLDESLRTLDESLTACSGQISAKLTAFAALLLDSLGQFDVVFNLAAPHSDAVAPRVQYAADKDLSALKDMSRKLVRAEMLEAALYAALEGNRPDLHASYLAELEQMKLSNVFLRMIVCGHQMWAAATARDRQALEGAEGQLKSIVEESKRNPLLAGQCWRSAGIARQTIGDFDLALARYEQALASTLAPLEQSEVHARIAECLTELGRTDEAAAPHRERARTLAPWAHWNYYNPAAWVDSAFLASCIERLQSSHTTNSGSELDPIPPVASKPACVVWILGVLAMLPMIGAVFGLILAPLSGILLLRRKRFAHDRKVGLAGLGLAVLSIAFACVWIANVYHRHKLIEARRAALATYVAEDNESDDAVAQTEPAPEDDESAEADAVATNPSDEDIEAFEARQKQEQARLRQANSLPKWLDEGIGWLVLIVSIMLHEIGHAVAAYWAGDPTARNRQRFSLNPIRHIDVTGSVVVPAILAFTGSPVIGWAKPVPINPLRFRHQRRWNLAVSLAGVSLNLLLALLATNLIFVLLVALKWTYPSFFVWGDLYRLDEWVAMFLPHAGIWQNVLKALVTFVLMNCVLAGFNLLPFPPLDGFGALRALLPGALNRLAVKLTGIGMIGFMCLIAFNMITYLLLPGVLFALALLGFAQAMAGM